MSTKKYIQSKEELMEKFDFELLLKEIHENKLTCRELENKYGIEQRFMSKLNKEMNLGICKSWSQQKNKYVSEGITKNDLYNMYILQELSIRDIASYYNVTHQCIKKALIFFNVCTEDEIRPFNYDGYYDNRRTSSILENDSRIYRSIMSEFLGRDLLENEVVHHIDMDRTNNDISNLFLFENERLHLLYHGYIHNFNHDYISPQEFLDVIYPLYVSTFLNEQWLYEHYIVNDESIKYIASICDISRGAIKSSLEEFGIYNLKRKRVNQYDKKCD